MQGAELNVRLPPSISALRHFVHLPWVLPKGTALPFFGDLVAEQECDPDSWDIEPYVTPLRGVRWWRRFFWWFFTLNGTLVLGLNFFTTLMAGSIVYIIGIRWNGFFQDHFVGLIDTSVPLQPNAGADFLANFIITLSLVLFPGLYSGAVALWYVSFVPEWRRIYRQSFEEYEEAARRRDPYRRSYRARYNSDDNPRAAFLFYAEEDFLRQESFILARNSLALLFEPTRDYYKFVPDGGAAKSGTYVYVRYLGPGEWRDQVLAPSECKINDVEEARKIEQNRRLVASKYRRRAPCIMATQFHTFLALAVIKESGRHAPPPARFVPLFAPNKVHADEEDEECPRDKPVPQAGLRWRGKAS